MKRIIGKVFALWMAVVIFACGVCPVALAAEKGYKFKYDGVTVYLNGKADKLIQKMENVKPVKKKSCVYNGDDYTYDGADFTLYTYTTKSGGTQYVQSVKLKNAKVKTAEGLKIGDNESKIKKKYGKNASQSFGVYILQKGKSNLYITVKDKKVTAIEYVVSV